MFLNFRTIELKDTELSDSILQPLFNSLNQTVRNLSFVLGYLKGICFSFALRHAVCLARYNLLATSWSK